MANVLITGGSGLIGWTVANQLLRHGHSVTIFDLNPNEDNLAEVGGGASIVRGDVTDLGHLLRVMKDHQIDRVVHLAAVIADQAAKDPARAFHVNVQGTANIFEAALLFDVARVVWTSSAAVTSVPDDYDNQPMNEDYHGKSRYPYGASKHACEVLADHYVEQRGAEIIGIRPGITYGVGRLLKSGAGAFNSTIHDLALGKPSGIISTRTVHQAMFNKDMGSLLIKALFCGRPEHHLFNAPVEHFYTNEEVLAVMQRVFPEVESYLLPTPDFLPKTALMDGARARRELAFESEYTLEQGVREMAAHFRDRVPIQ